MRHSHPRIKQTQIIVNFGDGAHGGARVGADRFLIDGDGRRKPFDGVDLGLFHLLQELAGVSGQAFHEAALTLGEKKIKGEGRFAGTAQAGDDGHFVEADIDRDIFQIVMPRASDLNRVGHEVAGFRPATAAPFVPGGKFPEARPGFFHDDPDDGDAFITKWHFTRESELDEVNLSALSEEEPGIIILQKNIKRIRYK